MDIEIIYNRYFKIIYRYLLSLCMDPHLAEELPLDTSEEEDMRLIDEVEKSSILVWERND